MPDTVTTTGIERSAAMWKAQQVARATATTRVADALDRAATAIEDMDPNDSDLRALASVLYHCTRALCTAMDGRT